VVLSAASQHPRDVTPEALRPATVGAFLLALPWSFHSRRFRSGARGLQPAWPQVVPRVGELGRWAALFVPLGVPAGVPFLFMLWLAGNENFLTVSLRWFIGIFVLI